MALIVLGIKPELSCNPPLHTLMRVICVLLMSLQNVRFLIVSMCREQATFRIRFTCGYAIHGLQCFHIPELLKLIQDTLAAWSPIIGQQDCLKINVLLSVISD